MMFKLYDNVLITDKNITGVIIDIIEGKNGKVYTVESDIKGRMPDAYGGEWPIYDCRAEEIVKQ